MRVISLTLALATLVSAAAISAVAGRDAQAAPAATNVALVA